MITLLATPIGNLGDLSERAREALRSADVVACEDTRRTRTLFQALDISPIPTLRSLHEHNERGAAIALVRQAKEGAKVVVVSDSGMPGISDPGEILVSIAIEAGVSISCVPGASAILPALVLSGFATRPFTFEGFLDRKASARQHQLEAIARRTHVTVLYEAPHRLVKLIDELATNCGGDRPIALCRELTKIHEEVWRGSVDELRDSLKTNPRKGECVVVISAAEVSEVTDEEIATLLRRYFRETASTAEACKEVASVLGVRANRVKAIAHQLRRESTTETR